MPHGTQPDDRASAAFPPIGPAVSRPAAPRAADSATGTELPPPFVATAHGAHTAVPTPEPTATVWEEQDATLPVPPELTVLTEADEALSDAADTTDSAAPSGLPDWLSWAAEPAAASGVSATPAAPWADSLPAGSDEADESPEAIEALDAALDAALGTAPEPAELPAPAEVVGGEPGAATGAKVPAWLDVAEAGFAAPEPVAEAALEVAERLERIAHALRTQPLHELLSAGSGDPLDVLLTGIALGYAQRRGR